jgi:hypothetical protein
MELWYRQCEGDRWGGEEELIARQDTNWLWQAEVKERLVYRQGRWVIFLVYHHTDDPLRFFVRHIGYAGNYASAVSMGRRLRGRLVNPAASAAAKLIDHQSNWN